MAPIVNLGKFNLPRSLHDDLMKMIAETTAKGIIERIWSSDPLAFNNHDVADRLGWLTIIEEERDDIAKYHAFADDVRGFADVLLMGMGGSSLCPEVLAATFGKRNFHVLDSTVPAQVKAVCDKLDLANTLFIVSSKSGSTLEPNCFKQYFFDRVSQITDTPGRQFVAITDPGSKLEKIARDDGFRHVFYGKSDIGGRFSALSAFGLAPAAAMGLDVDALLRVSYRMAAACRDRDAMDNPGILLGLILGLAWRDGRNMLTFICAPEFAALGAWLEQLVAESTGKNGRSIIPVVGEPLMDAKDYLGDRVFIYFSLKGSKIDEAVSQVLDEIETAGRPLLYIEIEDLYHIGQEFFRWEFATAVACVAMDVNPFDQPDVEAAKIEARKITDEYEQTGSLTDEKPFYEETGVALFTSDDYAATLKASANEQSVKGLIDAHIAQISDFDYFALLAYVEMNSENEKLLNAIREKVLARTNAATCLGFGPRFLHSTGQAYKGGENNGVFLQITSDDEFDLPVPGQKYTFGVVKTAQALGDFQVLLDRGRRALRVHLGKDVESGLQSLIKLVTT